MYVWIIFKWPKKVRVTFIQRSEKQMQTFRNLLRNDCEKYFTKDKVNIKWYFIKETTNK